MVRPLVVLAGNLRICLWGVFVGILIICVVACLAVYAIIRNQMDSASGSHGGGVSATEFISTQLPLVDFSDPLVAYAGSFVVLDVETTGLNRNRDEIVQFSAIRYERLHEAERFSTYIRPRMQISAEASAVNHITNEMLCTAPKWDDVAARIRDFLGDSLLIAHNAHFDLAFIERQLGNELPNSLLDTLFLSRLCIPSLQNHKLATVKAFFQINSVSHDAVGDCETTAALYAYCLTKPDLLRGHIQVE